MFDPVDKIPDAGKAKPQRLDARLAVAFSSEECTTVPRCLAAVRRFSTKIRGRELEWRLIGKVATPSRPNPAIGRSVGVRRKWTVYLPLRWIPRGVLLRPRGFTNVAFYCRRLRIAAIHFVSGFNVGFKFCRLRHRRAGRGGHVSWPGSQVEHFVIAVSTALQSSSLLSAICAIC